MLVSLNFIEKFISLPKIESEIILNHRKIIQKIFDITKIAPILTRQGFEVDSIKILGEQFNSVVVGRIESIRPHPTSTKLQICLVEVGEKSLRQIITNAANIRLDLYVAVALPGTKLPDGTEIIPTSIRDVESHGMFCSRQEVNLPINKEFDGEGIWELDNPAQGGKSPHKLQKLLGTPLFHALSLYDVILELSVTPNRPDVLSHEGVARELAAGFHYAHIPFEKKDPSFATHTSIYEEKIKADAMANASVQLNKLIFSAENDLNAPTFFMVLDSIKVTNSPAWLRNLLEALGQNSINNIVDASNYILLAYGQPNHAFDLDKIHFADKEQFHKKLILRHAFPNEKFLGLDGKERLLHGADCVVSDCCEVQALLGILGGEQAKVTKESHKIVIEFANPHPVSIRKASRRHGKQTDASFLFEKGIDASARFKACAELLSLLSELHGGKIGYISTVHSKNSENLPILETEFKNHVIPFTSKNQKEILGAEIISFDKQKDILLSLGFELNEQSENTTLVTVPHWRGRDVANAADLIEECIRVVGIDHIPSQPIISANEVKQDDPHFSFIEKLSAQTGSLGYHEVIGLHFMRADDHEKLTLPSINSLGEPIALINPIIGDEPLLHTSLLPDLLRKVAKNMNYGVKNGQLFHSCRTFQNYNAPGQRVFTENGMSLKLNHILSMPLKQNLNEYSYQYGYTYSQEAEQNLRPVETPRLAGVIFGLRAEKTWHNNTEVHWSLHDIMSHVIELARVVGVKLDSIKISHETSNEDKPFHPMAQALHPGRRVGFYVQLSHKEKLPIGWCGELHPKVTRNYEIDTTCLAFEINVANLMHAAKNLNHFAKINIHAQKFPTVSRDFAFLVDEHVIAKQIHDTVANSLDALLKTEIPVTLSGVQIFDIYRGKGIAAGKKSVAFKVSLEPTERTLTEKDIQAISERLIAGMEDEFETKLRG